MFFLLKQVRFFRCRCSALPVFAASLLAAASPLRAELVAYYDFNNPDAPLDDASGKNNHISGTAGTNPVWGATTGFEETGAYDFTGDRLIVPININPSVLPKMTWGAWVRTDTLAANTYKVLGHDNGDWDRVIGLDTRPSGFRYTSFRGNDPTSNTGPVSGGPAPVSTTAWTFLAASYDQTAKQVVLYVDLDASTAEDPLVAITAPAGFAAGFSTFAIGGIRPDAASESWDGAIDNVFVYDEVLTTEALTKLRNDGGILQPPRITSFLAKPGHVAAGQTTTLSWTATRAATVAIDHGAPAISGNAGSVQVSPGETTTYTLTAANAAGSVTAQILVGVGGTMQPLQITEFMAANGGAVLKDGDGNSSDWIELHNPNPFALELGGYALRDSTTTWVLPDRQLPAGGYLIVYASGQTAPDYVDAGGFLHTTFALSADGETLQLLDKNGTTVLSEFAAVPLQEEDVSWGRPAGGGTAGYMKPSTPGTLNGLALTGFVEDTKFDIDRGFFTAPFAVTITSATPGASISWTTDGSEPTATHGTIVPPPGPDQPPSATVPIAITTVLRARAVREGWVPTSADTQTYLFLEKVIDQPANPPGFPATWGQFTGTNGSVAGRPVPADYEMKPAIVNADRPGMIAALASLPTMSLVADPADLFGDDGILPNPFAEVNGTGVFTKTPFEPDRRCSVEWIQPDGAREFQIDCAVRLMGGWSRHYEAVPKKSLRLTFNRAFGPGKLDFPLFGEGKVDEFDRINLRATFSDGWVDNAHPAQYLRDPFVRETYIAMGQPGAHGTFVHLYINGLYWGLYNPTERPDDDYASSHFGGKDADYDALKHQGLSGPGAAAVNSYEVISGTAERWQQALTASAANLATAAAYDQFRQYVDVVSLADYIIVNSFLSNLDWPDKNWYAFGRRDGADGGFKFSPWDSEYSLLDVSTNRVNVTGTLTPARFYDRARLSPEFRLLFADRLHKHAFNGGPLTIEAMQARYTAMAAHIESAIGAEAARWGDNPNTRQGVRDYRKSHWIAARNQVLTNFFPRRPAVAMSHYRAAGLYPAVNAPEFTRHGGIIDPPVVTFAEPPPGTIHYTTDGSDPRLPGGAVNPAGTAMTGGAVTETYFALESTGWRYAVTATGFGDSEVANGSPPHAAYSAANWKHPDFDDSAWAEGQAMLGYGGVTGRTVKTVLEYGGDPVNRYPTAYFRRKFDVADAMKVGKLLIDVVRDDGVLIYINGYLAGRSNMGEGNQRYQDLAPGDAEPEGQTVRLEYTPAPGVLRNTGNVLAVELHQSSVNSSDFGMDAALMGQIASAGITLTSSGTVKARLRSATGVWSALTEAAFIVAADPASAENLVITKINYNPAGPDAEEVTAGFTTDSEFEFLELMNRGTRTINLAGVRFVNGISFVFPEGTVVELAAGERGVLVSNTAAFTKRYGSGIRILGQFTTGGLNKNGETLALTDAGGADILRFAYDDGGAWPDSPDGLGAALVLVDPATDNAGLSRPEHWRPSTVAGGKPGADDRIPLASWLAGLPDPNPLADPDKDGVTQLMAFATGARATTPAQAWLPKVSVERFEVDGVTGLYGVIEVRELMGAAGITTAIESSTALQTWAPAALIPLAAIDQKDGTLLRRYRLNAPAAAGPVFLRLAVKQSP